MGYYYNIYKKYIFFIFIVIFFHLLKLILIGFLIIILLHIYLYFSICYYKNWEIKSFYFIFNWLLVILGGIIYYLLNGIKFVIYMFLSLSFRLLINNYSIALILILWFYFNYDLCFWELVVFTKKFIVICQFDKYILKIFSCFMYIGLNIIDWNLFNPFISFTKEIGYAILLWKSYFNWCLRFFTASLYGSSICELLYYGPQRFSWPPALYLQSGQAYLDLLY